MKRSRLFGGVGLVLMAMTLGWVFSACSDDDETPEDATATLCTDLAELGNALGAYGDLTVDSTVEDVEDAQDEVAGAYDDVIESAGDVADARVDELEASYEELASAVDDVSGEDTVGEAVTGIAAQAAEVEAARASLDNSVNCG